jgi:hypothetical protein
VLAAAEGLQSHHVLAVVHSSGPGLELAAHFGQALLLSAVGAVVVVVVAVVVVAAACCHS